MGSRFVFCSLALAGGPVYACNTRGYDVRAVLLLVLLPQLLQD